MKSFRDPGSLYLWPHHPLRLPSPLEVMLDPADQEREHGGSQEGVHVGQASRWNILRLFVAIHWQQNLILWLHLKLKEHLGI